MDPHFSVARGMPSPPQGHRFEIVPDWVCEILSKSTESKDREIKMPIYARFGVRFLWLIDPRTRSLEAYALQNDSWQEIGRFERNEKVAVAPFEAVNIDLTDLWMPEVTDTRG